ncbi:NAD(P)/FAD-dependent oxidoreductase [Actinomadura sp. DC4]|uniref:NAD(P)/FAD-dependent oxidoreductase n=1 Tax=Actinomadura sp. DC4 TaxID=3055069 RepID=UPI0025B14479|nr:NAD(P)/FAD-dependent oxidoreductase [Actinomadura sp. DC4]MDN3353033.1 NAD(P)/FAD-dependent oxidoreductase [Actinomadura sp. DC4]
MTAKTHYEVVIIGGGAAGLSGALTLSRARREVLVIDAGRPRNAPAGHVHTYLSNEGIPPAELLANGRREVTGYGGEIVTGTVTAVERTDEGFRVALGDGTTVTADRLLVTTGLVDELPDVPGLDERWGRDVLHCPYCHGWEVRDQAIVVLATGPMAVHQALLWRQWSKDITLLTAEPLEDDTRLAAREIRIAVGRATCLEIVEDRLTGVRLDTGDVVPCDALTTTTRLTARAELLAGLGLEPTEQRMGEHVVGTYIAADPLGATEAPGVWVAGNVAAPFDQVIGSAAAGVRAGAAINADLIAEETRRAVAEREQALSREPQDARYGEEDAR